MKSDGDMGVDMGSDKMVNDNCLKKGPWTAAEDAILIDYVKKHGEGNWNAVQKNSGLMRCGKSCRLRWANHLRPNLKKGSFSHEEEKIIIQLHAKLGNKWARMAAQLPGRTDNEIKNYWNTRMKRRQRAGLPIYPQELRDETGKTAAAAAGFLRHEQEYQGRKRPPPSPLSPFPSSSACGSRTRQRNENDYVSFFSSLDSMNNFSAAGQNQPISSFYTSLTHGQYFKFYPPVSTSNSGTNGFGLHEICPISPLQQVPSSSSGNITAQLSTVPSMFQVNSGSFDNSSSFPPFPMGAQTDHQTANFVPGLKPELASFQPPVQTTTPAATSNSYTSSGGLVAPLGNTNSYNSNNDVNAVGSSGLLDALVAESQTLSRRKGVENFPQAVMVNGEGVMNAADNHDHLQEVAERDYGNNCVVENHLDDFSSSHSSMGLKPSDEVIDEMTSMDDDLVSLLNNFPSSMPLPDWYSSGDYIGTSNVPSSGVIDGNMPDLDRPLGSCCWKNMHGIC